MDREESEVIISLTGVELHTNHGVSDAEQEIGQRMLFDIEMIPEKLTATATDEVGGTVDYGVATEYLKAAATGARYRTLERLVTVIADGMLARFPLTEVRVRATKPEPPVRVSMVGATVEVCRRRD